jgi:hypothetical protein
MNHCKKIVLSLLLLTGLVACAPATVHAAASPLNFVAGCAGGNFFGFPSWDACLTKQGNTVIINDINDLWRVAFPIVESMIKAAGYLAVGFIIYGGVKYVKSQGDPSATGAAQKTIINALIGLIIAILSVSIVQFVAARF